MGPPGYPTRRTTRGAARALPEDPSLRHYLVIHQDRRQIVHHERRDDLGGVFVTKIAPPDPLRLDPPGLDLSLAAVYERLPFD